MGFFNTIPFLAFYLSLQSICSICSGPFFLFKIFTIFIFGFAGSLLLCGLFSSCGRQGLLSHWSAWASHCGGFSCCGAWALEYRLNSCGTWAYSYSLVCGIFLDQGWNLCLLHWQADSLPLSHQPLCITTGTQVLGHRELANNPE